MPRTILKPKSLDFQPRPTYPYAPGAAAGGMVYTAGQVAWDETGEVTAIGDVRAQSLKEIWHSEAFRELRAQHVCGTFDHPFCKGCTDWRQVHWTGLGDDRAGNIVTAA